MLNPIDVNAVLTGGCAIGRYPGQIHEGVAWWIGSCLVVTTHTHRIAVSHDGHPISVRFHERLCRGAINARHYAATVTDLGHATEDSLLAAARNLGGVPSVFVSTLGDADTGATVTLTLHDHAGRRLTEDSGLAVIRRMIAEDHVPIPVNDAARGRIEAHRTGPRAEVQR
ncbi:hypothetical protein [Streptomyces sp. NPDC014733]|uniref:hypothetical protein n=1 Tax=Streptomyces sp. NPDC014733 TaxID=3364885 RepID=UPI0036F5FBC3